MVLYASRRTEDELWGDETFAGTNNETRDAKGRAGPLRAHLAIEEEGFVTGYIFFV